MQPLFVHSPLLTYVIAGGYLCWVVLDKSVEFRQRKHYRAGARRYDKGSYFVVLITLSLGNVLCVYLAIDVPAAAIPWAREMLFWVGIVLVYCGIALRFYAITVLGRYFTTSVAVATDQQVVETGPYRFIRHPSYTGLLVLFLGFGLCNGNWLSLVAVLGCALIGLGYRIHVEERVLLAQLGQPYQAYMQRTKRLIPFVV